MKIHKFLILFCMAVSIFCIPVCAENVDNSTKGTMALTVQITYDVAYTVSDDVPSQQKWTQKSFKKRNESQYFVNLRKPTALIPRFA